MGERQPHFNPPPPPTWRKPVGILALIAALAIYGGFVMGLGEQIGRLPVLVQVPIYLVLGTIWLLPLRRFLIWMETGRWG
ncbi:MULTISPECIES: DUF2842 domain-containing protein [Novosphingobium]|uniref:DUF2842 domain-containing protein n=1 Tax=Novosphingobium TaxID=165696 RepID=UPI0007875A0F|nr:MULTISPECIES: DUF2842 domain-containing protein [Novosphingobium]PTR08648.1 uncharacterized protein DUF2842 [Novosphingobium sp. GV055]PUB01371.1 uncharacterized protein DUF2842 [Novosphingobium sp. GV061]PUB16945.1 uncharacterized protein DUF2842 [Novosphingobium sp. GV079]PUB39968.1 uncharacterized protein DUF2842 [Novosphingobium sp. GV027]WQD91954.1 DUF2842 domain-containing protein [Novosphingobium capsulatum]